MMDFFQEYRNTRTYTFLKSLAYKASDNKKGIAALILILLINITILYVNGSAFFEKDFLDRIGDQRLYFDLTKNLLGLNIVKTPYTLGYSLFLLPFVLITNAQNWKEIISLLIPFQSLILTPAICYMVFNKSLDKKAYVVASLSLIYYVYIFMFSGDRLMRYTVLGLIPLSETLAIFLLILAYYYFDNYLYNKNIGLEKLLPLSLLIIGCIYVRNTYGILFIPIFYYFIQKRSYRDLLVLLLFLALLYLPQLAYNYMAFHTLTLNGYTWWGDLNEASNRAMIQQIYHVDSAAMFSPQYLIINIVGLFPSYLLMLLVVLFVRPYRNSMNAIVKIAGAFNILFYLAYWWSGAGGLIDRFLMPGVILYLYFLGRSE
jgi:hypothetical protein